MARSYSEHEIDKMRLARWRCRTDLGYLCREVLNYKDVNDYVHGPIMSTLQQFPQPTKEQFYKNDRWNGKTWEYTPVFNHVQELRGKRRKLILAFRGLMKTTVDLQAHVVQWIINYPSVAIAIFQSNLDKSEQILKEIKHHFKYNETFRNLFPEHCPQKGIEQWGVASGFTTCARPRNISRREPSVTALSIDKENAGYHFDILKFSDIVEPGTTKTDTAMLDIERSFSLSESLLVSPPYWIDVEGTRYNSKELYQKLIDNWLKDHREGKPTEYDIMIQACFKKKDPKTGKEQTIFTPDTIDWPFLLDDNGKRISWWPKDASGAPRYPLEALEQKEKNDPYDFTCQYLINPSVDPKNKIFDISKIYTVTMDTYIQKIKPLIRYHTIGLDTAYTEGARSNYSAFVVLAWDNAGRAYVREIVRKKLLPTPLIDELFRLNEQYKPKYFVIEETQYVSGLRVAIESEFIKRRDYMMQNRIPWNLEFIKPDNQKSKETRIYNTLQRPIMGVPVENSDMNTGQMIRFVKPPDDPKHALYDAEAVDTFEALLKELKNFPLAATDDILDALADQFQPKTFFGRLGPVDPTDTTKDQQREQLLKHMGVWWEPGIPKGNNQFRRW